MTTMTRTRPKFISGYQGESDFQIGPDGYRDGYSVRSRANYNHSFTADHFRNSVVPSVGTVRRRWNTTEFPPREVVVLFPGFVGARWNPETNTIEYDGPAPQTIADDYGIVSVAKLES